MLSTDREEFEVQLRILCAGFDRPVGERIEAYWKGLSKMSLLEFARVVEFSIGEDGPEKIPTTSQCWTISKKLKAGADVKLHLPQLPLPKDNLLFFANRLLLRHILWRGGLGSGSEFEAPRGVKNCKASGELIECLKVKAALVAEFLPYIRERDEMATKREFTRRFALAIQHVSLLAAPERWRGLMEDPAGQVLFAPWMADGLSQPAEGDLFEHRP